MRMRFRPACGLADRQMAVFVADFRQFDDRSCDLRPEFVYRPGSLGDMPKNLKRTRL
jgi:hypothetical protein